MPRPNNIAKTHRPTLIHVSSFTPRKRTLDIVTAFSLAKLPSNSRLVMVGVGPDLEAAKALAVTLNVASRVEFVGAPKDIRPFLWQADLLVTASDEESGPLLCWKEWRAKCHGLQRLGVLPLCLRRKNVG